MAVAVVVIYPVEGNGPGAVEASERFALLIELTFCESREGAHVVTIDIAQSVNNEIIFIK